MVKFCNNSTISCSQLRFCQSLKVSLIPWPFIHLESKILILTFTRSQRSFQMMFPVGGYLNTTSTKDLLPYKHHVHSMMKRRGNGCFHVVSTWNTHGVLEGFGLASALTLAISHDLVASGKYPNLGPSWHNCLHQCLISLTVHAAVRSSR